MSEEVKKLKIDNGDFFKLTVTYDNDSVVIYQLTREIVTTVGVLEKIISDIKAGVEHA